MYTKLGPVPRLKLPVMLLRPMKVGEFVLTETRVGIPVTLVLRRSILRRAY